MRLGPGVYVYGARLWADMNPPRKARSVGVPFAVGTPKAGKKPLSSR